MHNVALNVYGGDTRLKCYLRKLKTRKTNICRYRKHSQKLALTESILM